MRAKVTTDADVLIRAATIIGRIEGRSPWDRCKCGDTRADHIAGVGCVSLMWCDCERFSLDKNDALGPQRRRVITFLTREAQAITTERGNR